MLNPAAVETPEQVAAGLAQSPQPQGAGDQVGFVQDLVQFARSRDLALADEFLTDVLARLRGWPVEELNRLA